MTYQNKHFALILLSLFHSILLKQLNVPQSEFHKLYYLSMMYSYLLLKLKPVRVGYLLFQGRMFLEFLILTALIIGIIVYRIILKPYLAYRKYCKLLPSLGYKTFFHPFRPLGSNILQTMLRDDKIYGDSVKLFK